MDFGQSSDQQCSRGLQGVLTNADFGNFPLLPEEGWTRHQQIIAKHPLWSGRGGDQIPTEFCLWPITTPSARLRMLRNFLLIAQPPLLEEEGKVRYFTVRQHPHKTEPAGEYRYANVPRFRNLPLPALPLNSPFSTITWPPTITVSVTPLTRRPS